MSIELDDLQDIVAFNNIKPIASPDPEKITKGYREIVLGVADKDEQDMYLKLRDEKHTWNNLYLGRSRTFKKGESEEHWNVVVPIVPRCYTTPGREPAHADHPRKGWIYIIRKCLNHEGKTVIELWRELRSDGLGNFNDVQLKYQRGYNHRPATGQAGFRIIVPYRINNQVHELWIAFSEVQWSWARIQQLKKDAELREKRMHRLDVSDCLENFSKCDPAPAEDRDSSDDPASTPAKDISSKPALIHRLDLATDKNSKNLPEIFKDPIPVVYLDDPVGIARELAARYQLNCALMDAQVKRMNKLSRQDLKVKDKDGKDGDYDPIRWLKSAVVFNTYLNTKVSENYKNVQHIKQELDNLYSKRNTLHNRIVNQRIGEFSPQQNEDMRAEIKSLDARIRTQEQARGKLHKTKSSEINSSAEFTQHIKGLREEVNEEQLKIALRVTERTELRENILKSKKNLTDFLVHELDTGEETPLVRALDDHFTLPAHCPHGKVIKEVPNKLPRGWEQEIPQDDSKEQQEDMTEIQPERVWPNWCIDAWSTVAGILGWLDKHEYTFDAELETNIDGWALRRNDAGCELLRKLLDPREKRALHKRLFPNLEASAPLKPIEHKDENPAVYVLNRFADNPNHDTRDRQLAIEEITQFMTRFLKGFIEVYCMADRKHPTYEKSIDCCQATILRTFQDVTGIDLTEKRIDAQQYWDYTNFAKEQYKEDPAGFAEVRKFFIMGGTLAEEFLDGQLENASNTLNAAPVRSDIRGTSNGKIIEMSPDNKDYKTAIAKESHGGHGSKEKKDATAASGGRSNNVPSVDDIPVATASGTTSITTRTKGQKPLWYNMTVVTSLSDEGRDKYLNRIKISGTAHLGSAGLLSIIEIINVKKSIDAFFAETNQNKNFDHILNIIGSSLSLISSFGDVRDAAAKLSTNPLMKESGARAAGLALDRGVGFKIAGLASTTLDIYFAFKSLLENIHQGDDAYIGDMVIISGGFLTILGTRVLMTLIVGAPAAAALAPAFIVGTIVSFIGYAIRAWIFPETKPIGLWAKHGPFGKVPFMGHKQGDPIKTPSLAEQRRAGHNAPKETNERYNAWCEQPEEAYRAIRDALFRPTIEMSSAQANMKDLISIKVKVPFKTQKSYLTIQYEHTEQPWIESGGQYVRIKIDPYHQSTFYKEKKVTIRYVENPADLQEETPGNRPLTDLKEDPPGTFHIPLVNHSESTVIVKVRLHVTDDGDFVIPYEPVFGDAGELHWVIKQEPFFNKSSISS